ncbi:MAG: hypothetical protein R2856_03410 [Caldilineaceae bacterium]
MANTLIFTVGSVAAICVIGLGMALLLNQKLRGRDGVRGIVFSPVMLSGAAIGIVWIYIFDPRYGLLDVFISVRLACARPTGYSIPIGRCWP